MERLGRLPADILLGFGGGSMSDDQNLTADLKRLSLRFNLLPCRFVVGPRSAT